jgi:hypothetical protein
MAGTIPLSMTQQFDIYGKPLSGGQLYIMQAGTVSTPQDAFADVNLSIKMPYPMVLDAAGRVPQFFLADASSGGSSTVKIRLQDKTGVVQLASDGILVIGPSGGSGGGGTTVDPNALNQTGNIILRYGVGAFAGHVRLNGLSIGNASSGATERPLADTQNLFLQLYAADSSLVLRDASQNVVARTNAANDYNTLNRNLALPDFRGYAIGALDDMGNTPAGRLTAAFWGGNPLQLGAFGGGESYALAIGQIPNITSVNAAQSISVGPSGGGPRSNVAGTSNSIGSQPSPSTGGNPVPYASGTGDWTALQLPFTGNNSISVTSQSTGGTNGAAHRTIGPRKLCTFYIRL